MPQHTILKSLLIRGYCFNKQCASSIYEKNPKAVDMPIEKALDETVVCESCGEKIYSSTELDLSKELLNILKNGKPEKKPGLRKV